MNRSDILRQANALVTGDRQSDYGPPEENFTRIATLWNAALGKDFTAADVALAMALLKISRLAHNPHAEDSWVDGAAYMALGGELSMLSADPAEPAEPASAEAE